MLSNFIIFNLQVSFFIKLANILFFGMSQLTLVSFSTLLMKVFMLLLLDSPLLYRDTVWHEIWSFEMRRARLVHASRGSLHTRPSLNLLKSFFTRLFLLFLISGTSSKFTLRQKTYATIGLDSHAPVSDSLTLYISILRVETWYSIPGRRTPPHGNVIHAYLTRVMKLIFSLVIMTYSCLRMLLTPALEEKRI